MSSNVLLYGFWLVHWKVIFLVQQSIYCEFPGAPATLLPVSLLCRLYRFHWPIYIPTMNILRLCFLGLSVCEQDYSRNYEQILTKSCGGVG